jgi:hypothetical protein
MADEPSDAPFRYHLQLTPQQLKITHTALKSLLDDFGHEQAGIHQLIHSVLDKLPDEHAIRAIQLDRESAGAGEILAEPADEGPPSGGDPAPDEGPPPAA